MGSPSLRTGAARGTGVILAGALWLGVFVAPAPARSEELIFSSSFEGEGAPCSPWSNYLDIAPLGEDGDLDGLSVAECDCDDTDAGVGPTAFEVEGDALDNDCDTQIDEPKDACDGSVVTTDGAFAFAKALGLCGSEVLDASFGGSNSASHAIATSFGTAGAGSYLNVPTEGTKLVHLSTGAADTGAHDNGSAHDGVEGGGCSQSVHPDPLGDPGDCGGADPVNVCDASELSLTLRVPQNAQSFSFDLQLFTAEYPTFRCLATDDAFAALLGSQGFTGNISRDPGGARIGVNSSWMEQCLDDNPNVNGGPSNICSVHSSAAFANTGYVYDNTPDLGDLDPASDGAAATPKLTTFAPVTPGETITLRFLVWDEGSDLIDTSILLDNFRWDVTPVESPATQE